VTLNEYITAWALYLLATAGCIAAFWKMTSLLGRTSRGWIRLWMTTALLVPGSPTPDTPWSAPALLGSLYELLSYGQIPPTNGLLLAAALMIVSLFRLWQLR